MTVLEVVQALHRRLKRPVTTREVAGEIRRGGGAIAGGHPNGVRKRLETLATSRTRGPQAGRAARLRKLDGNAENGTPTSFWLPASVEVEDWVEAPRSSAEWVRRAVCQAYSELLRPVTASELRWWYDQLPADSPMRGTMDRGRLGRALKDALRTDADHAGSAGRLHAVSTAYTCFGGAPTRVVLGPASNRDRRICRLLDSILVSRSADEIEGIAQLRRLGDRLRSDVFRQIATIREETLAWDWATAVPPKRSTAAIGILERGLQVMRRWVEEGQISGYSRESRLRQIEAQARHVATLAHISTLKPPVSAPRFRAGQLGLFNLEQLEHPIQSVRQDLGLPAGRARHLVEKARRFPPSDRVSRRAPLSKQRPIGLLDRVDAVACLLGHLRPPRASFLLEQARLVLGETFRNPLIILDALKDSHALHPTEHQTLVVALGWLGWSPDPCDAVRDFQSYEEASAWTLAVALAEWETAEQRIHEHEARFEGAGARVIGTALRRLGAGGIFTVVG